MKKIKLLICSFFALGLFSACAASDGKADVLAVNFRVKTPDQVSQILAGQSAGGNAQVLDVRTGEEYQTGCLAGAKNIDIKAEDFDAKIAALDKNATYLLYCRTGKRSANAADRMLAGGFGSVMELEGGIVAWEQAGKEISRECK